jgi:hypothetical protein
MTHPAPSPTLKRVHAKRLREMYRSAGWPCLDGVEIDLLAAGLLERVTSASGHETLRVTNAGIAYLAGAAQTNRGALSAHEALVNQVAQTMLRDGRIAWKGLSLRAGLAGGDEPEALGQRENSQPKLRWKVCMPDVFSIRNSSRQEYLEPVVHEIKVSRSDLLGDLKLADKRAAYLAVGGQCWYVLGKDSKGRLIAEPDEIPAQCGVLVAMDEGLSVARVAPKRPVKTLPFWVWMALAKAAPVSFLTVASGEGLDQAPLASG